MAKMADVAKRAGVALSTVSHALSGKRTISEETSKRILQAMADLNYQPHALARGLATQRSGIVALLLPPVTKQLLESQFVFIASTAETVRKMGYNLLLWTTATHDDDIVRMVQQGYVEGVILMEVELHDHRIALLRAKECPFSLIGRRENNDGINLVDLDFEQTMDVFVRHLAELGHREIGLIGFSKSLMKREYGPAVRSALGFRNATKRYNIRGKIVASEPTSQDSYQRTRALLGKDPAITALICPFDINLNGVVQAIYDLGLRIPEDINLVALTSVHGTQLATLTLTRVEFPASEMGRIGAELLIRQLQRRDHKTLDADKAQQIVLRAELKVGQSTGPARVSQVQRR